MAYRIRELREKKKLTQEQLAQMSGVSRTTILKRQNALETATMEKSAHFRQTRKLRLPHLIRKWLSRKRTLRVSWHSLKRE